MFNEIQLQPVDDDIMGSSGLTHLSHCLAKAAVVPLFVTNATSTNNSQ